MHKASTYFGYFGEQALPDPEYGSYDLGDWHVVVLNTNCTVVEGGCGEESPAARLAEAGPRRQRRPVHPRVRTPPPMEQRHRRARQPHRSAVTTRWSKGGATLYLSGHEADYERFAPLDAAHQPDPEGVRQFVVGTGGQSLYEPAEGDATWRETFDPIPSEFFDATTTVSSSSTSATARTPGSSVAVDGAVPDQGTGTCVGTRLTGLRPSRFRHYRVSYVP